MSSQPKILVASINFAPDHAGIGVYSTDFPLYLAEGGDAVTMVTGFPYYPQWRKRPEDFGRLFQREIYQGVNVRRGYLFVPKKSSALRRLWHEFTFCFFAGLNMLRAGRHEAIVVFSPPFFLGFVGLFFKWLWRCPLVINVQDLPLDAALALGMIKPGLASRIMTGLEGWIYRRADLMITISPTMMDSLRRKGVREAQLALVPNWIDVAAYAGQRKTGGFLASQPAAQGKFTVAYAGNLGIKQGVDLLLRLAAEFRTAHDLHFFIIGDGADRVRLEGIAAELALPNLTFLPFMKPPEYRAMLADVDLMFVAQRSGAGDNFFPSKLLGLMAQSKPLLVAADVHSELGRVIAASGCGALSPYEDLPAMVRNLTHLKSNPAALAEMGRRGHESVQQFDRATVLGNWRQRILALIKK
jgi:colanic acid biosynthesis glycosyl transferase WcaI